MSERRDIIVVGGGLAGLAAACRLADAGRRVLLLEKRPFLGGRAYSYTDGRNELEVDNGQHVFLGCCTEYIGFLKSIGAYGQTYLQPRLDLLVIDKLTGASRLHAAGLPAPLHLLPSFLAYKPLSLPEKLLAVYGLLRANAIDRVQQSDLDGVPFAEWLRSQRQTANAIRNFWNLIILPTLNDDVENVSTDLALMVLQQGFLRSRRGSAIGYAKVGLSRLVGEAALRYIEERGGRVTTGSGARELAFQDGHVTGVLADGELLEADAYLLAVPPSALSDLLPPELRDDPFFTRAARLQYAPIVNIHLWYDRPVMQEAFAAFVNSPMQWVFNKSRLWGVKDGGQYLDISLSGAYDFVDMPGQELIDLFTREISAFFPASRTARLLNSLVVKQPQATFSPRPGVGVLRPSQRTPIANLFLAGDWTDTGWPATMESAVCSGQLAARTIVSQERGGERIAVSAVFSGLRD
ncbi:MAG TPA: hydroxysqualene dehydroxylase HpnE [Dehalococcoidia bacterium]|nr:hydroxysqualene dehydroxylase HpnE [Dehalococcoidia bacterium]